MKYITSRFLEVYKYLKKEKKVTSASDFAEKIGISSSLMSEINKGRSNIGLETLQKTVNLYPEINTVWLVKGMGKMLVVENSQPEISIYEDMIELQKKHIGVLEKEIAILKEEFRPEEHPHRTADEKHNS